MTMAWAKLVGDGARAEGFEAWMSNSLDAIFSPDMLAGMSQEQIAEAESRLRLSKIINAAVVESARIEDALCRESITTCANVTVALAQALSTLIACTITPAGYRAAGAQLNGLFSETLGRFLAEMEHLNG